MIDVVNQVRGSQRKPLGLGRLAHQEYPEISKFREFKLDAKITVLVEQRKIQCAKGGSIHLKSFDITGAGIINSLRTKKFICLGFSFVSEIQQGGETDGPRIIETSSAYPWTLYDMFDFFPLPWDQLKYLQDSWNQM